MSPTPHTPSAPAPRAPGTPGRTHLFTILLLLVAGVVLGAFILRAGPAQPGADSHAAQATARPEAGDGHGHAQEDSAHDAAQEPAQGPNGGQLFTEKDFSLELLLSEEGGEPRFKAWASQNGQPLAASDVQVTVSLVRPHGEQQEMVLQPQGGVLTGAAVVAEPHVFKAGVAVQTPSGPLQFTFTQNEGLIAMADAQVAAASIALEASAPATIHSALQFPGEIKFNEDRTAHIVPRAAGVVEQVSARLGQQVKKGQVLAVVSSAAVSEMRSELQAAQQRRQLAQATYEREKNLWEQKISPEQDVLQARQALREAEIAVANATQKLRTLGASASASHGDLGSLPLRAPFDAMVLEKHMALGEAVKEDTSVFTLSDLSSVWAELNVPARDLAQVRVGEQVVVRAGASDATAQGTIAYVGSLIGEQTRTAPARVVLANPQGAWRPGLYVTVEVRANEKVSPVTVPASALQSVDGQAVVFLKVPGGFVPQPVQTGRSDGKRVEIVQGLQAGALVAAAGSFVIKSEQGKSSATHTH